MSAGLPVTGAQAGYGGGVTTYGSARVRTPVKEPSQVYARRRFGVGVAAGAVVQLLLATILGFMLVDGMAFMVRVVGTLLSSMIATPLVFTGGFALMLKDRTRSLGGGVVLGGLAATILLVVAFLLT